MSWTIKIHYRFTTYLFSKVQNIKLHGDACINNLIFAI